MADVNSRSYVGTITESEPVGLYVNPSSNVALLLFEPSFDSATLVAFDAQNRMNIQSYLVRCKPAAAFVNEVN